MKNNHISCILYCVLILGFSSLLNAQENQKTTAIDVEKIWSDHLNNTGGLTWKESDQYPDFNEVSEGDTFLVKVKQGKCLMEFYHNRWRRANDVYRWHETVNEYKGCPYVFD
ncbi:MAG: hypothetical protein AB8B80_14975 [Marinicellaceae bacterium]